MVGRGKGVGKEIMYVAGLIGRVLTGLMKKRVDWKG